MRLGTCTYTHEKNNRILVTTQLLCKEFYNGFPEMSYLAADFVEGVPGLHRRVEKVAPVSSRNLTGWPPSVKSPLGLLCGAEDRGQNGKPWALSILILDLSFWPLKPPSLGMLLFQWSHLQVVQGLGGGLCLPLGHCPLTFPSLPQQKQTPGFCLCPPTFVALRLTPCRAIMRALAFLLSLFSFSLGSSWLRFKNTDVAALTSVG